LRDDQHGDGVSGMNESRLKWFGGAAVLALASGLLWQGFQRDTASAQAAPVASAPAPAAAPAPSVTTVAGMPPVIDARNLYSETASGKMNPAVVGDLTRIYVPNLRSNDVYVIDPAAMKVVDRFKVGIGPQHIVPSWDMRTLWATNNAEGRTDGSLTPIDPKTGKPGKALMVDDPYNMYSTPDGKSAIVVAEARKRLDFRDPKTMAEQYSIAVPGCTGVNHAAFSIDGRHLHLRVRGYAGQDRLGRAQGDRLSEVVDAGHAIQRTAWCAAHPGRQGLGARRDRVVHRDQGHAARHPQLARRQAPLRR
jgi:YVTN family beta-propeller protein